MKTKRIFTLLLLLGAMVTGISAQSTIPIKKEKPKSQGNNPRTVVLLPAATIDGQVLTISFADDTDFSITVTDDSGSVVYVSTYTAHEATITLPQLPEGSYYLRIEDEYYIYIGEFEIAD